MGGHGISLKVAVAEKNLLPELVHHGQVFFPVDPGYIVKQETDGVVGPHLLIEAIYELPDLLRAFYFLPHRQNYPYFEAWPMIIIELGRN